MSTRRGLTFPPILFDDVDAAAYIAVSVPTLNRMQAAGLLIPKALGGKRGFLRDDLEAFARSLPDWKTKAERDAEASS